MSKSLTRSFAGGELSPGLWGRLDLGKFQTGLALCQNFIVTPQGPVDSRPGFEYVLKAKQLGAALIPFEYSDEQSFALEFGEEYIRFHTQGGTLLETAQAITGISQASPGVLTYSGADPANGDWVYLTGISGMTELNGRYVVVSAVNTGANTFALTDLFGAAIETTDFGAYTSGGTMARVYEIETDYLAADLFDLHFVQSADVLTIVHRSYPVSELRRLSATSWTWTPVSFAPGITAPAAPTVLPNEDAEEGDPVDHEYVITAVAERTLEESVASASTTASQDLTAAGNYLDVSPAAEITGAVRYNVYKRAGVFGYIGQTTYGKALRDDNITPDTTKTPPLVSEPFTSEQPRAVSYYEQRRVFGGGGDSPQHIWTTRSGTESNLTYSVPTQDDDAITARIVAREAQTVRHLVPLGELLALTSGGVWQISSPDGGALTPAIRVRPQSYVGASMVQPMVTSNSVLYAQARGSHIRELTYAGEKSAYAVDDVCIMAPHLFDFRAIVQLAYAKAPQPMLWAVRDDGMLLGMTHSPEHEVKAWHRHVTTGDFKSVCAVAEGAEDGVYVIVEREINGATVQYIERMHSREFEQAQDAFCVDAGSTYDGGAASIISGLHHLEGQTVAILADGGVEPPQVVEDGQITLSAPASLVHVGLGYDCDLQTLPLTVQSAEAFGVSAVKNVNEVALRLRQAGAPRVGPAFDNLREYAVRTPADPFGAAPPLLTQVVRVKPSPSWGEDGAVCLRQSDPLPMSVLWISIDASTGG